MVGGVQPDVTVIVPTYERPELTRLAIESALAQTFTSFRVLVGDDSRSDRVEAVVHDLGDDRVVYSRNEQQRGAGANWVHLIRSATTPLVASLNDDDTWDEHFLERLAVPMLEDPDLALAFGDYWLTDADGALLVDRTEVLSRRTHRDRLLEGKFAGGRDDLIRLAVAWNAPQPATCAVMRTAAVSGIELPEQVISIHDLWFNYRLACSGAGFYYVPERLAFYRCHSESLTESVGFVDEEDYVFEQVLGTPDLEEGVADDVRRYWAHIRWVRAVHLMASDAADAQQRSQRELELARHHLTGARRIAALAGSRSSLAWRVGAHARDAKQRRASHTVRLTDGESASLAR